MPPIACVDVWEDLLNAKSKESIICEDKTPLTTMAATKEGTNEAKLNGQNTSQKINAREGMEKCEEEHNIVDIVGQ